MTYDFAAVARILADRAGPKATVYVLRNLRVLVDIERTPNTRDEFSVWLSDLASSLERGLVAQAPSQEDVLSGLLRGMARRVSMWRRQSAKYYADFHHVVEEWQRNDEAVLAENQRLADELARAQDELVTQKRSYVRLGSERDEKQFEIERLRRLLARHEEQTAPNPWFTPAEAEFPIEAAERADRLGIGYAFPTQEWRQQQVDEATTVRTEVSA